MLEETPDKGWCTFAYDYLRSRNFPQIDPPAAVQERERNVLLFLTILQTLLRGETAEGQIRSAHLMPALVVDTINEAFYDEIGDNILEYDGNEISLIEDYREDVAAILGGNAR